MANTPSSLIPKGSDEGQTVLGSDTISVLKSGSDFRFTIDEIVAASTTAVAVGANSAAILVLQTDVTSLSRLPTAAGADSGKLVSVNSAGSYVLVANAASGFRGVHKDLATLIAAIATGLDGDWALLESGGHAFWNSVALAWQQSADQPPVSNLGNGVVTTTTYEVTIATGTNVVLQPATTLLAGIMTAASLVKLNAAVTQAAGKIDNATIDADRVNVKKGILPAGPSIAWDIKNDGQIAEVSLDQNCSMPLMTQRPAGGGTYLCRVETNGFTMSLSAFEAPEGGTEPTLSTVAGEDVNELHFIDWGTDRVTVHSRKDIRGISS